MILTNSTFNTKRLILRAWTYDDLDDFYEYAKVEGVGEMAGWKHHENIEITKSILKSFVENKNVFAIVYKENNKVIGSIEIRQEKNPLPEDAEKINENIGFVLSKEYWGRGIMPEAAGFLIDYVFKNNLVDNIYMGYYENNLQSKKVQEKLGLTKKGETIKTTSLGTTVNLILMRITKNEWIEKNS